MKKFVVIDMQVNPDLGPEVWSTVVHLAEPAHLPVVVAALSEAFPTARFRSRETAVSMRDLSMRDQFAMAAWGSFSNAPESMHYSALAELAYKVADEMLQARLK
jgi:hypothetical protein